jgi:uncharacterized C2H2 Zn-finger protein
MKTAQDREEASSARLACPRCGATMNRHAEKIVFSGDPGDSPSGLELEGAVEEFHTCPGCRYVLERRTR